MTFIIIYNIIYKETYYSYINYGGRSKTMKKGIHPKYNKVTVVCTSCGNTFETGSILKEMRIDTCANCHPFYTGQQKFVQAAGRVERFNKRLEKQGSKEVTEVKASK